MEILALKTTNTPLPLASKKVLLKKLAAALVGMFGVTKLLKTAPPLRSTGVKHPRDTGCPQKSTFRIAIK